MDQREGGLPVAVVARWLGRYHEFEDAALLRRFRRLRAGQPEAERGAHPQRGGECPESGTHVDVSCPNEPDRAAPVPVRSVLWRPLRRAKYGGYGAIGSTSGRER